MLKRRPCTPTTNNELLRLFDANDGVFGAAADAAVTVEIALLFRGVELEHRAPGVGQAFSLARRLV
jgi:hypothetical protein